MLKTKKTLYFIFAIISFLGGVTFLVLNICKVFGENNPFRLMPVALLLLSVCIILRPYNLDIKRLNEVSNIYRGGFFNEVLKDRKMPSTLLFKLNDKKELYYESFTFSKLSYDDAIIVINNLVNELSIVSFGKLDDKKKKILKDANVEEFYIDVEGLDGQLNRKFFIKDSLFINMKRGH